MKPYALCHVLQINVQSKQRWQLMTSHRSQLLMSQTVLPMLRDAAGLTVTVHQTTSPGDASAICAGLQLEGVDLLLFVGGDGTIFEGLQVSAVVDTPGFKCPNWGLSGCELACDVTSQSS